MTVSIIQDPSSPLRYRCANFKNCGVSSSHDPMYVSWFKTRTGWDYVCSEKCRVVVDTARSLA